MQMQLNRIEAMLNQLLTLQPGPVIDEDAEEAFQRFLDQGMGLDEAMKASNEWKERQEAETK